MEGLVKGYTQEQGNFMNYWLPCLPLFRKHYILDKLKSADRGLLVRSGRWKSRHLDNTLPAFGSSF